MNIIKEEVDSLNANVKVKLIEDDYQGQVSKVLNDYRKKVRVDGFRPGKVPMGMIKKMYGKAVKIEEINKLISKSVYEYLYENKIDVLGSPLPKEHEVDEIDWENQKEFEFTYEMGLSPAIQLKLQNEKVTKYIITKDDKLTQKYIDYIRKRFGTREDAETSEEDDVIYGDFTELNKDGTILEGGVFKQESPLSPTSITNEKCSKLFIGLKIGGKISVNPRDVADNDTVLASMLGISKEQTSTIGNNFQYSVTKISRIKPAELSQEFYDLVYGKDIVKNEEEFINKNAEDALAMINSESEKKFNYDLVGKAIEKTKVPLPDEFLKKWLVKTSEKPVTLEEINSEYNNFSNGMKWQLIRAAIIKENELKIEEEEIINEAKGFIKSQYAQYGQLDVPEEELKKIAGNIIGNEEERKKIIENLFETKSVEVLRNTMKTKEKEVVYEEFMKIVNQESKKSKSGESGFAKFLKSGFRKKQK